MDLKKKQENKKEGKKTKLKQLREALEMTQVELAVAIGVSPGAISKCEQGVSELYLNAGSIKQLHLLMMSKLGYGVERLPESLKEISQEEIFA